MLEVFGVPDLFVAETSRDSEDLEVRLDLSGRYELTTELGHGGMGTVYLANDLSLGRLVALKVVAAEAAAGIGADSCSRRFATSPGSSTPTFCRSSTPAPEGIVRTTSCRTSEPARSAHRLKKEGRLPLPEVVRLVQGIAAGLSHAHEHRVLHCDIKPENILVDGLHPFVMDFGIARRLHAEAEEWAGAAQRAGFLRGYPGLRKP